MASRPYVRVYHDDLMRDYPTIYADDCALSTWLRLLVLADKMWPALPELPRSVRSRGLAVLTEVGLVVLVPPHGYKIRGYESERQARQDAARHAAAMRWHSKGNADGNAESMPSPRPVPKPSPNTKEDAFRNAREKRTGGGLEPIASILPRTVR